MKITKNYIKENYSYAGTGEKVLSESINKDEYFIFEINSVFYAIHSECFTLDYYKENFKED